MMPQLSEPAVEVTGGSTATTMRDELGPRQQPALVEIAALPQPGHAALDDLALELLPAQRRVAVAALHLGQEGRRQVVGVVGGARAAGGGGVVVHDALQERDRPRRGGDDDLRQRAQAQRELQRVPGDVGPAPLAQLVAPGGVELRPAQAVGIVGGEHLGDGAVGPDQPVAARPRAWGARRRGGSPSRPERPSIMTLRTWPMVSPTSAMRCERRSAMGSVSVAWARTHSAPARVLPEPRPPSTSQVCQGSPLDVATGGSWSSRERDEPVVDDAVPLLAA